jgi:hypothetical protein
MQRKCEIEDRSQQFEKDEGGWNSIDNNNDNKEAGIVLITIMITIVITTTAMISLFTTAFSPQPFHHSLFT